MSLQGFWTGRLFGYLSADIRAARAASNGYFPHLTSPARILKTCKGLVDFAIFKKSPTHAKQSHKPQCLVTGAIYYRQVIPQSDDLHRISTALP
jgi:hypothetical protein